MPKIPDYMDYGARPSLRTNRVDMPHQGGQIIADAVTTAANRFANVMEERKGQQDRLTYTRLKAELLKEDVRIQRELEEAGNWQTFEDDYREQISEARERIQVGITNPHDRVIFDADSGLLVERGVTSMAAQHRTQYLDFERASMGEALQGMHYDLTVAKPYQRRDIIQSAHAMVQARIDSGIIDQEAGKELQRQWVRQAAGAELLAMDDRERVVMLERAIDANLDPNDYQGEKGTGSLADFLPQDVRIEMLRRAKVQIEAEDELTAAQNATDAAFELYQADTADNQEARLGFIRKNLKGRERQMGEQLVRERHGETARATSMRQDEILKDAMENIRRGQGETDPGDPTTRIPFTVNNVPRAEWILLGAGQQQALRQYSDAMQQGRSFAFATKMTRTMDTDGNEMPSYSQWRRMTDQQKLRVDLDSPTWLMAFTEQDWRGLKAQQEALSGGSPFTFADGLTNDQMLLSALIEGGWTPATDRDVEEQERFARSRLEFDRLVQDEMRRQGVTKLANPERRRILGELLSMRGYTKRRRIFSDYDEDSEVPAFMMNAEQLERAFKNIEDARQETFELPNGRVLTVEEMLIGHAMNAPGDPVFPGLGLSKPPSRDNLERAYFAYLAGLGKAEIERRLRGQ